MTEQLEFGAVIRASIPRADSTTRFNGHMLALAREAKGLGQKDLASVVGFSQGHLSKLEAGVSSPHEEEIRKFMEALEQERWFFFNKAPAFAATVSFYRRARTFPSKLLNQCRAQMNVKRLNIEREVGSRDLAKRPLPHFPPEQVGGPEEAARRLRDAWALDDGPVRNLIQLIEAAGCVVVDHEFPSLKLDGLTVRAPERTPIIFLNKDLPKSRRRLTLAHEFGHLVMHVNPHEKIEEEAWRFASEFLMPAATFKPELTHLNLDVLGKLKVNWGVSMQAALYRAKELRAISSSYYQFLCIQIAKCGFRVNEPFEDAVPDERPTDLKKRLDST